MTSRNICQELLPIYYKMFYEERMFLLMHFWHQLDCLNFFCTYRIYIKMYAICLKQHLLQICRLMPHLQAVVRAVVSKNRQKWPIPQVERKVKNYSCTIFVKKFTTLWDAPRKRTELKSRQLQGHKHIAYCCW